MNDEWPPKPDLNQLDYHVWGAMLQAFHKLHLKPKTIPERTSSSAVAERPLDALWPSLVSLNKIITRADSFTIIVT